VATAGIPEQKKSFLPDILGGDPQGRDIGDPRAKAWATCGGHADFYKVMARTAGDRDGISCFLVPADAEALTADPPGAEDGAHGAPTATRRFDDVTIPVERQLGQEGDGLGIALAGLDAGRLGIAAVATGLSRAAPDAAVAYAIADGAAVVEASRCRLSRSRSPQGRRPPAQPGGSGGETPRRHGQRHAGGHRGGFEGMNEIQPLGSAAADARADARLMKIYQSKTSSSRITTGAARTPMSSPSPCEAAVSRHRLRTRPAPPPEQDLAP
jgi:hypothetical protein